MYNKRTILTLVLAAGLVVLGSACNTLRGMGKDVQRVGEKIQEWSH